MRILRDGEYFAEGDSLEAIAEIAGEDVSRYSFHVDDIRRVKDAEMRAAAAEKLRSQTQASNTDEAISAAVVRFFQAWQTGEAPPKELETLAGIHGELQQKLHEIWTSDDPGSVTW